MKRIFLLTLVLGLAVPFMNSQNAPITPQLESLQKEVSNLSEELDDFRKDVKYQFREAESGGSMYFWGIIVSILLAIGSGPLSVIVRSKLDRKNLEALAATKTNEAMEKAFPPMAETMMNDYLNRKIPAMVESLVSVSKDRERDDALRLATKILVVSETEEITEQRAERLRGLGYRHISTSLPVSSEEFPVHDVCLIDLFHTVKEYDNMSWKYLNGLIKKYAESTRKGLFFCIKYREDNLEIALLDNKGMANSEPRVDSNLMDLIRQLRKNT